MASKLTEEQEDAVRSVLFYFGHPSGWESGGFTTLIMQAYQKADPSNRARLRMAFPVLAEAMDTVINNMTGIKELAERLDP